MQNTSSSDEEFYDAIGDQAQIEAIKSNVDQTRSFSKNATSTMPNSTPSKRGHNDNPAKTWGHSRNPTLRLGLSDEQENTLTITVGEIKDSKAHRRDSSAKNLQQILDRLDETSINVSSDASKMKDGGGFRESQAASSTKHGETRPGMPETPKTNKLEETFDKSIQQDGRSLKSLGFFKGGEKNPLQNGVTTKAKRNFFSLNRKRNSESEFARENVRQHNKNSSNFDKLICLQMIEDENDKEHSVQTKKVKNASPTWIAKFSPNNKFLAAGGGDGVLRVYRVSIMDDIDSEVDIGEEGLNILDPNYVSLLGHKHDIIDISWYKASNLILTSSIDKMVILWNIESQTLVKIFEHSDIVPCLSFHPLVNEFFATGCFDKMIRIWDLNEGKVVDWVQASDLITALTFSPDKNMLLVGFYKGTIKIYRTDQGKLKFTMEIACKNTFSWGKLNKVGKKVTGIIFTEDYEFLVMTNDSRMRLVDLNTYETKVKYKGHSSGKYHIQPSYNYEKELILSGSEDEKAYVWNKNNDHVPQVNPLYFHQKANRNSSYEYFKPFGKSNTTCSIWVPFAALQKYKEKMLSTWKDIYVDNLMVLFSADSKVKILGNLIELDPTLSNK